MWNFRQLDVWKKSFDMVEEVYRMTNSFPKREDYGLSQQLRRAIVGISSNIAEGCGRRTSRDFIQFLHNAIGSAKEVENQLMIAERLNYIDEEEASRLIDEMNRIGKMLVGLIRNMRERDIK